MEIPSGSSISIAERLAKITKSYESLSVVQMEQIVSLIKSDRKLLDQILQGESIEITLFGNQKVSVIPRDFYVMSALLTLNF